MKKLLFAAVTCATLAGCSTTGLNVSWSLVATYNTPHATPGAPVPTEPEKRDGEPAK